MSVAQCAVALVLELWTIYSLDTKSSTRRALLSGGSCNSTAIDGVPAADGAAVGKRKAAGKAL
jgi:hypothetical protein